LFIEGDVMEKVLIAGAGMTVFAKTPGRGVRDLATHAAAEALQQAGVPAGDVERIYLGNAVAGVISHQEMIRGQVAFRHSDLAGLPVINVDNACASGGTALHLGWEAIASGRAEVVLVVGAEQLTHQDKTRTFAALRGSTDIEEIGEPDPGDIAVNSILMEFYAEEAATYLSSYDATSEDLARVAVKNRRNANFNPLAQYRGAQTMEEVLGGRMIVAPLTLPMCSPVTDGGAALVLCSEAYAKRLEGPTVTVLAAELAGGNGRGHSPVPEAAAKAYRQAGVGPGDMDLIELHDAAAPAELIQYAEIGLCDEGEGHHLLRRGVTEIGGATPVNTSGGLMSRGHPLGATGCAQVVELWTQLLGRAGGRQVDGATTGMAVNAGGWLGGTYAVTAVTVLQRES
jgi:acetyl-CoA acetyltransferase